MWVALSQSFKQSLNQASPQARIVWGVLRQFSLDTVPTAAASLFGWAPDWACTPKGQAITKSASAKRPIRMGLLQVHVVGPTAQASPGNGPTISGEILNLSGHAPPGAGPHARAPGPPTERASRAGDRPTLGQGR